MNRISYADQYRAALRYAAATVAAYAAEHDSQSRPVNRESRLYHRIACYLTRLTTGRTSTCGHLQIGPQPLHAALWSPGRLVCSACLHQLRPATALEDSTCDACRRLVTTIHPTVVPLGLIVLSLGLCPRCLPATTHPTHPAPEEETAR